jgi:hypothetical protein
MVDEIAERCNYLVALEYYNLSRGQRFERSSVRARMRALSTAAYRTLPSFGSQYMDLRANIERRQLEAGFIPNPQTVEEAEARGTPRTIGEAWGG